MTIEPCSLDERCMMCKGEVCLMCMAGLVVDPYRPRCEHDVIERHTYGWQTCKKGGTS